jgi:SEFIR domain
MEAHTTATSKVFISYSHDSPDHVDRVLSLANRLRAEGIDCHIDQYETSPSEGWPRWMMNHTEAATFILVVCTETYNLRFRGKNRDGKGLGAKWEGAIITQEIYEAEFNNSKFIPVLFSPEDIAHIPTPLRSATYYDLSADGGYESLYRRLSKQPGVSRPDLGELRPMPPLERKQDFSAAPPANTSSPVTNPDNQANINRPQAGRDSGQLSHGPEEAQGRVRGSWIFGSLLLIFFIIVFSFGPDSLPEYKTRMLALISALIAGLFGFFLTGDVGVEVKALQSRFGEVGVKAAGGIALFVLTIIWWVSPFAPVKSAPVTPPAPIESYKIRLTALDLQKRPVEDAQVWSSPKGELTKVSGGWELIIPTASLPTEKKVTVSIRTASPPLFRQIDLQLADKPDLIVNVQLERDTSSDVHGLVVGEDERPIPDALVQVQGYTGEPARTDANGAFKFPTRWGRNEQVYLNVEKAGYKTISEYPHLAGEEPAYIILKRR